MKTQANTYTVTERAIISPPTPAPDWTAVYEDDEGIPLELPLAGWVVCRVTEVHYRNLAPVGAVKKPEEVGRERQPPEVCGLVMGAFGMEVAEDCTNMRGYRHRSVPVDHFCTEHFRHEMWRGKAAKAIATAGGSQPGAGPPEASRSVPDR